eukprot:12155058-Alexandrium_andersonii.AAC.1
MDRPLVRQTTQQRAGFGPRSGGPGAGNPRPKPKAISPRPGMEEVLSPLHQRPTPAPVGDSAATAPVAAAAAAASAVDTARF